MQGKEIRLKRLFKNHRKLLLAPMDHGVTAGPIAGIEDIRRAVKAVAEGGASAVIVHKGMASQITEFVGPGGCELIIHLSASTSLSPNPNKKVAVCTVEQAIRLGATGVSVHVNLGSENEGEMLEDLGRIAEDCQLWGIPLLAMMYVRDGHRENEYSPDKIKHAARVAEELGADIVKVNYSGSMETFTAVTGSVKIPVVIAGGPKMGSPLELLTMIVQAVKAGAGGVAIGRNVFQYSDPAALTGIIRSVLESERAEDLIKDIKI